MTRRVLLPCLFVLASPLGTQAELKAAPAPVLPQKVPLYDLLEKPVDFEGIKDRKTTIEDALYFLEQVYGCSFVINERAFRQENLPEVGKCQVANPNDLPAQHGRKLRLVLDSILLRLPVPSGATYLIRDNHIEITTKAFAAKEVYGTANAALLDHPLVSATFTDEPLSRVLEKLGARGQCNIILDPRIDKKEPKITVTFLNVPRETAILLVADMAGLVSVPRHNTFYITTAERAGEVSRAMRQQDRWLPKPGENPIGPGM
jgi:hypothetical protein